MTLHIPNDRLCLRDCILIDFMNFFFDLDDIFQGQIGINSYFYLVFLLLSKVLVTLSLP